MGIYCPKCGRCAFKGPGQSLKAADAVKTVMEGGEYGCVHNGGDIVKVNDELGIMRGREFHPRTPEGAAWHQSIGAPF